MNLFKDSNRFEITLRSSHLLL